MQIRLNRISDKRHRLEVVRADGSRDSAELVSRETLVHDLLHYAVESALATQGGFWGTLASGKTMADLKDPTGEALSDHADTLMFVEGIVGRISGVKDLPADQAWSRLRWYSESQGENPPDWCTRDFVADVLEHLRQLRGRWNATPYGGSMVLAWS